jgi:hypothetical protein
LAQTSTSTTAESAAGTAAAVAATSATSRVRVHGCAVAAGCPATSTGAATTLTECPAFSSAATVSPGTPIFEWITTTCSSATIAVTTKSGSTMAGWSIAARWCAGGCTITTETEFGTATTATSDKDFAWSHLGNGRGTTSAAATKRNGRTPAPARNRD